MHFISFFFVFCFAFIHEVFCLENISPVAVPYRNRNPHANTLITERKISGNVAQHRAERVEGATAGRALACDGGLRDFGRVAFRHGAPAGREGGERRTEIGGLNLDALGLEEGEWCYLDEGQRALLTAGWLALPVPDYSRIFLDADHLSR